MDNKPVTGTVIQPSNSGAMIIFFMAAIPSFPLQPGATIQKIFKYSNTNFQFLISETKDYFSVGYISCPPLYPVSPAKGAKLSIIT